MKGFVLIAVLMLAGCTATPHQAGESPSYEDMMIRHCRDQGGIWYKSHLDAEYHCVDKQSAADSIRRMTGRL